MLTLQIKLFCAAYIKLKQVKKMNHRQNQLKSKWMLPYIIGLKEPGHRKEGLGGLCGPKMLPLYE